MRKLVLVLSAMAFALLLSACSGQVPAQGGDSANADQAQGAADSGQGPEGKEDPGAFDGRQEGEDMILTIDDQVVPVTWESNQAVDVLRDQVGAAPITVQMSMYGGNEQVGPLGKRYPADDAQTTTHCGDIVLYSASNIVVFYGSNSWAYTRLGKIELPDSQVRELLGGGDVSLTLSL